VRTAAATAMTATAATTFSFVNLFSIKGFSALPLGMWKATANAATAFLTPKTAARWRGR